jgi:hypothetical protein
MKLKDLIVCVNPRKVLNYQTLLPAIIAEHGQVIEPGIAWRPDAGDPFLKSFAFLEALKKAGIESFIEGMAILLRGHRRHECCVDIRSQPNKYPHDVYENAGTMPVIVIEGITEEMARNLALDDQDKEALKGFEVALEAHRRFELDHTYDKVSLEMAHGLYRFLMKSSGDAKYSEAIKITDGKERNKKIKADLRNGLDQWLYSGHLLGPAIKVQVISWIKKRRDGIDLEEHEALCFEANLGNLRELRSVYTKSRESGWEPITGLSFDDSGKPVIVGGNEAVREKLTSMMDVFRSPEKAEKGPKLPKAQERNSAKDAAVSEVGKLFAAFYCGEASEGRTVADEVARLRERKDAALTEIVEALMEPVEAVARAVLSEKDPEAYKGVWINLSLAWESTQAENANLQKQVASLQKPKSRARR